MDSPTIVSTHVAPAAGKGYALAVGVHVMQWRNAQDELNRLPDTDDWGVCAAELLLRAAEAAGCTDLHLGCQREYLLARGRREGTLITLAELPPHRSSLLIARLKVMARVPSFVKHEPQDGRMEWLPSRGATPRILRISFLPTIHGENVVIRFPDPGDAAKLSLLELGMEPETLEAVEQLLARREGAILLTGPGSSGKTTTMYAMLERLHSRQGDRLHVITIEDPVERDLGFGGQVQVHPAQGLTFDAAMRAALRQDPNVIMLGEIRDAETARIAVQAGMSGHLVISTLHAGRASRVFSRLLSMGIEPYLVASAIGGSIAQRLARTLCSECAGVGCAVCGETGHAGRRAIFEMCVVSEELRELILAKAPPAQIATEAMLLQSATLTTEGQRLVKERIISQEEYEFLLAGEE